MPTKPDAFDSFVESYEELHKENIRVTGEEPDYFAEYKARVLARCLSGRETTTILDFGCGLGGSIPFLRRYFPDSQIIGVDLSEELISEAARRYGDIAEFVRVDQGIDEIAERSCDLVFAACVFHHIAITSHAATLDRLRRRLRPGGHLFVFEHNPYNPLTRHAVTTCRFDADAVLVSARAMASRICNAGYSDIRRRYCTFIPRALATLRPVEPYFGWLPLGAQYYVWARR